VLCFLKMGREYGGVMFFKMVRRSVRKSGCRGFGPRSEILLVLAGKIRERT
jgi:hypothetical protein